jgi:hypothetical protein
MYPRFPLRGPPPHGVYMPGHLPPTMAYGMYPPVSQPIYGMGHHPYYQQSGPPAYIPNYTYYNNLTVNNQAMAGLNEMNGNNP